MKPVSPLALDSAGNHAVEDGFLVPGDNSAKHLAASASLRRVLDSISESFVLIDAGLRILDVNQTALKFNDRTREQLIGRPLGKAFPGSDRRKMGLLYKRALAQNRVVALEHQHVWPDGRSGWLETRACPVEGGGLAIFFRDISEQHDQQSRLRQSELRFRAAVEAVDGALWTNDSDGNMTGEQPGWARLTGQTRSEYQGRGWLDVVHPDDAELTLIAWNGAVAVRKTFVFEHRVKRRDGEWRHFSIRAIPELDERGELHEWVGVHTDVTDTDQLLGRNAETFAALVRNNPFGIFVVDSDLKLQHLSHGAEKIFSSAEPLLGRDFPEIINSVWTEPFASEAVMRFRGALETGAPYVGLKTIKTRASDNPSASFDWRIERITLPDGSDGIVCYFYDLSEQLQLQKELRQALEDKDLLAREIEHRVRNSLTIVSSLLMLQRASARNMETKAALAAASSRVLAIGRVHERLYRVTDGGEIEFGNYLEQMCRDIGQSMEGGNITFDVETVQVTLPVHSAVPLGIAANELITNACKYCESGKPETVIVRLTMIGETLVLSVTDTGPGVPDEFRPEGEAGLGLRAIQVLVRQINGTISYPQAGGEARFEITVPLPEERTIS